MMEKSILKQLKSDTALKSTGQVEHFVLGKPIEQVYALQIVSYAGDHGYYLIYLDKNGYEITDTYHNTIESAVEQATFEFKTQHCEWS